MSAAEQRLNPSLPFAPPNPKIFGIGIGIAIGVFAFFYEVKISKQIAILNSDADAGICSASRLSRSAES
jgi:hypothetical protein